MQPDTPAVMQWDKLLSALRFGESQATLDLERGRTPFHKDYDRIIFSSAFRRLDRKTQVHPLSENDHVHTRLTHSLEVACVGRSLGTQVGQLLHDQLPHDIDASDIGAIVQAACLAHDIGNPPYGHTGEDAIRNFFVSPDNSDLLEGLTAEQIADLQTYEGNAQGFRIATKLEYYRHDGGMRLTYATIGTFLKYPWTVDYVLRGERKKFGCFGSELADMKEVADVLGLLPTGDNAWCRHPLVYLVEAADDICYCLIDLEDGVELNLLRYYEVETLFRPLFEDRWEQIQETLAKADHDRRRLQILRGQAMEVMVQAISSVFMREQQALMGGQLEGSLIDHCSEEIRFLVNGAKQLARERIFNDGRKLSIEVGSYATLSVLLRRFLDAVRESVTEGEATYRNRRILGLLGRSAPSPETSLYHAYMKAVDYVAGMTDSHAAMTARQFNGYHPD